MEKARRVLTVPSACGWSDLGSWEAVFDFRGGASGSGTSSEGDGASDRAARAISSSRAGKPVCVIGLSDVAVVESADGLLVMKRGASDEPAQGVEKGLAR